MERTLGKCLLSSWTSLIDGVLWALQTFRPGLRRYPSTLRNCTTSVLGLGVMAVKEFALYLIL